MRSEWSVILIRVPVFASCTLILLAQIVRTRVLSYENSVTDSAAQYQGTSKVCKHCAVSTSHTLTEPSSDSVRKRVPSGAQCIFHTMEVWPVMVCKCCPDEAHTLALKSSDTVRTRVSSGENSAQ